MRHGSDRSNGGVAGETKAQLQKDRSVNDLTRLPVRPSVILPSNLPGITAVNYMINQKVRDRLSPFWPISKESARPGQHAQL